MSQKSKSNKKTRQTKGTVSARKKGRRERFKQALAESNKRYGKTFKRLAE